MSPTELNYQPKLAERSGLRTGVERLVRRWWPVLVTLFVLLMFATWDAFALHVDEPPGYSSPAVVESYTGIAPPAAASRIHTAGYRKGTTFSHYVRFEAPSEICMAYAQRLAHGIPLASNPLPADPTGIDRGRFSSLNWFDLAQAKNLAGAEPGPSVWVDQSRGVFYFYEGF